MKKRVLILGSTGSIGRRTLDVAADFDDRIEIVGLSAHRDAALLARQIRRFRPEAACLSADDLTADQLEALAAETGIPVLSGPQGLIELVERVEADIVVASVVGFAGLAPTLRAIELGRDIALANKEVLVVAGDLVVAEARRRGVRLLPIDSEHCAVFQCLNGGGPVAVRRIILTASGGPFRGMSRSDLEHIEPAAALDHPTWKMGRKISVDSATLMNKGFEVIEGRHLFDMPADRIEVVVHPQSVIHSMVEFVDGSVLAQMGITDMYLPIQNALFYPERLANAHPAPRFRGARRADFRGAGLGDLPLLGVRPRGSPHRRHRLRRAQRRQRGGGRTLPFRRDPFPSHPRNHPRGPRPPPSPPGQFARNHHRCGQ